MDPMENRLNSIARRKRRLMNLLGSEGRAERRSEDRGSELRAERPSEDRGTPAKAERRSEDKGSALRTDRRSEDRGSEDVPSSLASEDYPFKRRPSGAARTRRRDRRETESSSKFEDDEEQDTSSMNKFKNGDKESSVMKFDHLNLLRQASLEERSGSSASSIDSVTETPHEFNETKIHWEKDKERYKLKILSTLVPDEILQDPVNRKPRSYDVALLFPDVSGFTELCQKYDKTGKGGPSRLTEVLNGYIGSMIKIVLSRNGDVCKFGGDAFLCMWKVSGKMSMSDIVNLAIESGVDIQKNCGEHTTDVGVKLRVKMAVSAGKAYFSIIGTTTSKYFVIVGNPVVEVRDAEQLCKAGDIIVSPSAWKHVSNYMLYNFTYHPDGKHVKVHDFGPLWKSVKVELGEKGLTFGDGRTFLDEYAFPFKSEDFRPFILPPVMKSIDLCRSLDHLTEMRQVAIVFFNITAKFEEMSFEETIKLSNDVYRVITMAAAKTGGAVNKLTLFDKDMALLTVFGLKGFKHELASLVALQFAYTCLSHLENLQLESASAGVTTGMAYCGVIGHPLRKEYTMMGHAVNMAARLMCAYKNIVSTDRNTFLHSKLEASHFEVLEHENLKGIQSTGPFYKFHLTPQRRRTALHREDYPILGRDKQIESFKKFLREGLLPNSKVNFMIILGKARIGKSRLVARLVKVVEERNAALESQSSKEKKGENEHIDINVISLAEYTSRSPFTVVKLIFLPLLGLSEASSTEERADKILSKLLEAKAVSFLAAFNMVFNVQFDLTPQYLSLDLMEQQKVRMHLLNNLYAKCFSKREKWLMVIEDAEFMDDESWNFLAQCTSETPRALYLLTIGQRKDLSSHALNCLDRIKAEKITLTEIDKWFYSGLACQILAVRAIPAELENLLQSYKSSGNPGWLESFLLSLIQNESIYVTKISSEKLKSMELVFPPESMLTMATKKDGLETSNWINYLETFETLSDTGQKSVRVCLLGRNFKSGNDNENELTMDVMFIKMMDILKPVEQMILKVASVLGNNIQRSALKFILLKDGHLEEKQLAKAIKNLFEIKVLICAKGDVSGSSMLVSRRMVVDTSIRKEVVCECKVTDVPAECKDLPKYAHCKFMRFKCQTFRDTVYNLLLDEQKKKFHNYSIEFLRKTTTRCKACRSVPFNNILGREVNDEMKLVCNTSPMHGLRSMNLDPKFHALKKRKHKANSLVGKKSSSTQRLEAETGFIYIPDKGDCQCSKILLSVYSVLVDHAVGCGRKDIKMEVLLEYAAAALTSYNFPLAIQTLDEALSLANELKEEKEHLDFCNPYIYAKIYTLMGSAKLNLGRIDESLESLKMSLAFLTRKLPDGPIKTRLMVYKVAMKLKTMVDLFPEKFIGSASEKEAHELDLLSECLGLISIVQVYLDDLLMAKYTALWALSTALESNRNFYGLCIAYTTNIDVAYHSHDLQNSAKLELYSIQICSQCSNKVAEVYEWEAIGRLYRVIFKARHLRAEIEDAVTIGFQSVKIASVIRSTSLKLDTIPGLIFALVQLDRLSEAVVLIKELEFISHLDSDKTSKTWYYTICLNFHLYTGFTLVPIETCENFLNSDEGFSLFRDPEAKLRLCTSLWLWCIRNSEWELIKSYGKALKSMDDTKGGDTPVTVFVRLERLEGFLIYLVHKIDSKSIHSINAAYAEIHALMNRLKKDIKLVKVLKPRYQLLTAYYRQIRYRDESYHRLLNQAQSQAEKMKDKNATQWIIHLRMVWNNAISPIQRDAWNEHSRKNFIEWHESDSETQKGFMYSLPLPKY